MIKRLGETLGILWDNLCFHVQRLFIPEQDGTASVHAGTSRVLVVKSPDPSYFREAVFILRDDLFLSPDADRRSILRQARSAAEDYTLSVTGKKKSPLWRGAYFLMGMAAAYITAKYLK